MPTIPTGSTNKSGAEEFTEALGVDEHAKHGIDASEEEGVAEEENN